MAIHRSNSSSVIGILSVAVILACSCWWVYGQSCTCDNLPDIDNFIREQQIGGNSYKRYSDMYKEIENITGEPQDFSPSEKDKMDKTSQKNKTCSDPTANWIGSETDGFDCVITSYTMRKGCGGQVVDCQDPNLSAEDAQRCKCLMSLVQAHEQTHVAECEKTINAESFLGFHKNYLQYKSLSEFADEEAKAHKAGEDYAKRVKNDLLKDPCCKPQTAMSTDRPSLVAIFGNLFR